MRIERRILGALLALCLMAGCDGSDDPDGGTSADAAPPTDAGAVDGGPVVECVGCTSDEICVAGVCVAGCGADGAALTASLGAGLTPVQNVCRAVSAVEVRGSELWDLTTTVSGNVTSFSVSRYTLDSTSPTLFAESSYDTGLDTTMLFPSGYLAIDPSRAVAAYGFTTNVDFYGALFLANGTTAPQLDAVGNFDAAFLDDDVLLINGLGSIATSEGQGVYAVDTRPSTPTGVHVLTNMGSFSGSVEATADYVLAGGVDDAFAGHVYVVPRASVVMALTGTPIDVTVGATEVLDPGSQLIPSTFRVVDGRLVTLPFGGPITSYATSWDGSALTLSDPQVLATGGTFTDALAAPTTGTILVHGTGLLVTR